MKKVIFYLEDDKQLAENTKKLLEYDTNFIVYHFFNGKEALLAAKNNPPDIVICDISMPEMTGLEFCEIFRNLGYYDVPFIFLTGSDSFADVRKGMNLGADDYLTKPVSIIELFKAIKTRIKKNEKIKNKHLEITEELKKEIQQKDALLKKQNPPQTS